MHDVYLYTFEERRSIRCEFTTALVFNTRTKSFQIRRSQDYETQAKIEHVYLTGSAMEEYLAHHPEHRETAKAAIESHLAENPVYAKAMRLALAKTETWK